MQAGRPPATIAEMPPGRIMAEAEPATAMTAGTRADKVAVTKGDTARDSPAADRAGTA